jgi:hypothetical protein
VEFLNSGDSHSTFAQYKARAQWIQGFGKDFLTNGSGSDSYDKLRSAAAFTWFSTTARICL